MRRRSEEFRNKAIYLEEMAKVVRREDVRQTLTGLAQLWRDLAHQVEALGLDDRDFPSV